MGITVLVLRLTGLSFVKKSQYQAHITLKFLGKLGLVRLGGVQEVFIVYVLVSPFCISIPSQGQQFQ
ncbi:MAG: hypothetical protein WCG25_08485 [bacterium]